MTALSRYLQRNIKGLPSQGSGTSLRKTRIFPSEENPLGFRVRSPRPFGRGTVPAHPQTASSWISPAPFARRSSQRISAGVFFSSALDHSSPMAVMVKSEIKGRE